METAGAIVAIICTVIVVAGFAQRWRVAAPLALLVVGVAVSYVPFIPEPELSSEVVLVGLLPPLLYAAAIRTSLVDFRANWTPILGLSVGLVLFTAAGVGLVTWWLLGVPFARGLRARGDRRAAGRRRRDRGRPADRAAPADRDDPRGRVAGQRRDRPGVAAHRHRGLPPRGRGGRPASTRTRSRWASVAFDFARAVVLGVGFGVLVGVVIALRPAQGHRVGARHLDLVRRPLPRLPARRAAARLRACSPWSSPGCCSATSRRSCRTRRRGSASGSTGRTIQFILENVVFLMLGMQMRRLVEDANESGSRLGTAHRGAAPPCWPPWSSCGRSGSSRSSGSRPSSAAARASSTPRRAAVISWAGMRGVVTLAAAFTLPEEPRSAPRSCWSPWRSPSGTLLMQGLDAALAGPDPRRAADPTRARTPSRRRPSSRRRVAAGLKALEEHDDADDDMIETLRQRAENRTNIVWERLGRAGPTRSRRRARPTAGCASIMLEAERAELLADPRRGHGRPGGAGPRLRPARHRGVDARPHRGALRRAARGPAAAARARRGRVRAPRRPPRPVRGADQPARLRGVPARRHHLGAPAAVPRLRPRRLLRLLARSKHAVGPLPRDRATR